MKNAHITITTIDYLPSLEAEARGEFEPGDTWWTVNRHVKAGDELYIYVCAPVQAIVAVGLAASDAAPNDNPQSEFFGGYMAEMENVRMLPKLIPRLALCDAFPEWRYWRQPRQSVRVPAEFVARLAEVIEG